MDQTIPHNPSQSLTFGMNAFQRAGRHRFGVRTGPDTFLKLCPGLFALPQRQHGTASSQITFHQHRVGGGRGEAVGDGCMVPEKVEMSIQPVLEIEQQYWSKDGKTTKHDSPKKYL